ncbi:hypothetical protein SBRCBS47491_004256 [Sporothrix bragantina]|uniref:beta-glucosidase n=1 Tax=Sporothrix bragantina TaxID=671064 RepID=A0ABP0BLZ7_9PEZI
MPDCLLAFRHTVIKPFLQASRDVFRVIEDYDVQHVSASSLIIRILQSTALQNATGRPELAWHLLGQASLLSLRLGLYQETSLQNVADPVERQLLRSCFCTLYAADNASCAVGNRESILRDDCFPGGRTTALYATANHATCLMNGERQSPTLTAASLEEKLRCGIELMPRLWSAAASLINRMSMPSQPINDEEDSLIQAYLEFSAILDDLPTWLQTSSLIAAEMRRGAVNDDNSSTELDVYQDTAFWVQRCTIVMSFNCARLLILQKCIETGRCNIMGMTNAALPVQMKKIDMVLDFLRELEEIPFVYHQIKGEPSVERVRCVGSILLEMIQTASNEIILGRARSCFARLMEILAKLDSKASDELATPIDVEKVLRALTLDEKVQLLAGKNNWATQEIDRLGIPSLTTSDGPHGVRGTAFCNGPKGMLTPSATAMGATFDTKLLRATGSMLALEAREREYDILLGPTVCLQRSPLIGRGFEAFAEDPWLSGMLASAYVQGVQEGGVACSIKHYAAHDQSTKSTEDSIVATTRTLRETHMLPFQLAVKHAQPWSFMTSYNKVNGTHASEDKWLMQTVLRDDWGWQGLVMSDWFGTYSTTEAVEAGLDLEMPGPTRWRGDLLRYAVLSRKLHETTVDDRIRNMLEMVRKVQASKQKYSGEDRSQFGNSQAKQDLCRELAGSSIVLLKNTDKLLPLDPNAKQTYGLIGPAVVLPAASGGGSADLRPYYVSKPLDAIIDVVGKDSVTAAMGCKGGIFLPGLETNNTIPGTTEPGYLMQWYATDPESNPGLPPTATTSGEMSQMYFADSIPDGIGACYWLKVTTVYTAPKTTTMQIGLCVVGKGRMYVNDCEVVDLWTSQPPKTISTPMFDRASMEVTADLAVEEGKTYTISVMLKNESIKAGAGALNRGGLRIGCAEKADADEAVAEAVALARKVDVPIIIAGLNKDYETEASDRRTLELPAHVNYLIESVLAVNPKTIVVSQAGCPITMPWLGRASAVCHAWYGGQETGRAISDVLFGKTNPSGRISVTFPKRLEDTPAFLTFGKADYELLYGEGVFIGHRYYEKTLRDPLFYFGYGLSYTTFTYKNLQLPATVAPTDGDVRLEVMVDVHNTGDRDGHEIVQVYVSDLQSSVQRPIRELKGFHKVWIKVGATETVTVALDKYAFSYWSEKLNAWLAEAGTFRVIVATSANPADEAASAEVELTENLIWTGV